MARPWSLYTVRFARAFIMPVVRKHMFSPGMGSNLLDWTIDGWRCGISFPLANIATALDLASEAVVEAIRRLEDCRAQVCCARVEAQEPLPEEADIQVAMDALRRIKQGIQSRTDTVTQQLKSVQMNFMIEAEGGTQGTCWNN